MATDADITLDVSGFPSEIACGKSHLDHLDAILVYRYDILLSLGTDYVLDFEFTQDGETVDAIDWCKTSELVTLKVIAKVKPEFGPSVLECLATPAGGPATIISELELPYEGPSLLTSGLELPGEGPATVTAELELPYGGPTALTVVTNPVGGPSSLTSAPSEPLSGPTGVTSTHLIPASGPSSLTSVHMIPANGPAGLTSIHLVPASGPSSLAPVLLVPASGPSSVSASEAATFAFHSTSPSSPNVNRTPTIFFNASNVAIYEFKHSAGPGIPLFDNDFDSVGEWITVTPTAFSTYFFWKFKDFTSAKLNNIAGTHTFQMRGYDSSGQVTATDSIDYAVIKTNYTAVTDTNFTAAISLWFSDEASATSTYGHIRDWDVSGVTDMENAFSGQWTFDEDLSTWDVSNVTNMKNMFSDTSTNIYGSLEGFDCDLQYWDTSKVTDMSFMFSGNQRFNGKVGNWDVSSVTDMTSMFGTAYLFNQDISSWDTSAVTDMGFMFQYAMAFNQLIDNWDTSAVTRMSSMFNRAYDFIQDISDWDVSAVTNYANFDLDTGYNNGGWPTANKPTF